MTYVLLSSDDLQGLFSALRRLTPEVAVEVAKGGVYITGGVALTDGLKERLQRELTSARPVNEVRRLWFPSLIYLF